MCESIGVLDTICNPLLLKFRLKFQNHVKLRYFKVSLFFFFLFFGCWVKIDHQIGYGVEVTGLSPSVTEKYLIDFFSFSGTIQYIDIVRSGEQACTAYVMFRDSYSQEIVVLLSGTTILDQRVCITCWRQHHKEFYFWNATLRGFEDESYSNPHAQRGKFNAGEAVTKAQEVVKTMFATGFVLGKDALSKAKTVDESHGVSAAVMARVSQLEQRIGLTDKIFTGLEAVRMTEQRFFWEAVRTTSSLLGLSFSFFKYVLKLDRSSRGSPNLWSTSANEKSGFINLVSRYLRLSID
ncbi:PREDICTED: binding partner of ACD11 1-like [Camelina sativa]|uniref:Binding partner of ACD11 1-like n=1 Tax=Camelina sativa TaxID=90675 RepID=A0ABM0WNV5_CAMSA|nr:PREDICTED: binding partner of ACD11 1-like [Camelina sativa]